MSNQIEKETPPFGLKRNGGVSCYNDSFISSPRSQWQASAHRVDQPVALEEPVQLGKAGIAIGSTEVIDEKKPKRNRVAGAPSQLVLILHSAIFPLRDNIAKPPELCRRE